MFLGAVWTVCEPRSGADLKATHSHWAPDRAADAVRMGLRRQAHQRSDATAFHGLSAAAHGSGNDEASAPKTQSGRTAAGSTHALRLALRHEAHRHEDAETLRSMPATAKGFAGRRHVLQYRAGCESTMSDGRRWAAMALACPRNGARGGPGEGSEVCCGAAYCTFRHKRSTARSRMVPPFSRVA